LLDVGCGSGTSTAIFQADGWDVSGLDLNETAVGHARALLGDRVRLGDFQTVRYPDRSFDVVRLSHSLEHMHDPMSALREARRILDTDGYLVVTVPNAGSWEASLFGRWWFPWELPRHLYHFERDTLTRLLKRAGFRIRCLWSGTSPAHFMTSLERVWRNRTGRSLPARRLLERWVVRPFCLMAGHSGRGTELTAIAVKNGDLLQCR
jgi:SAM-dependent methyltransferase